MKIKYLIIILIATMLCYQHGNAQVGLMKNNPDKSAVLDLSATNKGFLIPRLTTDQRDNIVNPAISLLIFNTTTGCHEFYSGISGWFNYCWGGYKQKVEVSSGGTAIVSTFNCSAASAGTMTVGTAVSGVTQTITATVIKEGTYNITTTANGVTFAGSGTFAGTGNQNIVLTATGTPVIAGSDSFALNTTPDCSFDRTTNTNSSSNGTAIVSAFNCSTASAGTMTEGIAVSGVTQTVTATVTKVGTYNITATANGVTFAGSGTFAATGAQDIVLTATGTPTTVGSNSFVLNATPDCSFDRSTVQNGSPSTGGTAVVSGFNCSGATAGTMMIGTAVNGVTQTITATVTKVGTYNITATANGVTFAGSGTFAATGAQNIVLTATGTPTAVGSNSFVLNTTPGCSFDRTTDANGSSNGTAIVSDFNCSVATVGDMTVGSAVAGVTQTITATVTKVGTYDITATMNGVAFAGKGTFAATGAQDIVLTATGTPIASGIHKFVLNTTPNCSFDRNVLSLATGGTGDMVQLACESGSVDGIQGEMLAGVPVNGVKQIVTAWVTRLGTYDITTTANGVTFAGKGTFTYTGMQTIVLNATGTPINSGVYSYALSTTPSCSFVRGVSDVVTSATGRIWLDRNLGADRVATSSNDSKAYGSLFQWGRKDDNHELMNRITNQPVYTKVSTKLSALDVPVSTDFIAPTAPQADWRSPGNDNLWQGVSGINNPCPVGFRLPTIAEFNNEKSVLGITNSATAHSSVLKFATAGNRTQDGTISQIGTVGNYWTSNIKDSQTAVNFKIDASSATESFDGRASAKSVRCIKN